MQIFEVTGRPVQEAGLIQGIKTAFQAATTPGALTGSAGALVSTAKGISSPYAQARQDAMSQQQLDQVSKNISQNWNQTRASSVAQMQGRVPTTQQFDQMIKDWYSQTVIPGQFRSNAQDYLTQPKIQQAITGIANAQSLADKDRQAKELELFKTLAYLTLGQTQLLQKQNRQSGQYAQNQPVGTSGLNIRTATNQIRQASGITPQQLAGLQAHIQSLGAVPLATTNPQLKSALAALGFQIK
jgi:hypothetical protein